MIGQMQNRSTIEIQRETLARRDIVEAFDLSRRIATAVRRGRLRRRFSRVKFAALLDLSLEEIMAYESAATGVPMCVLWQMSRYLDRRFQYQIQVLNLEIGFLIGSELGQRLVLH